MNEFFIGFLFFIVAFLYSTVGHGGASGYIALMSLLSFAPEQIKPLALLLNVFVSGIAFFKFYKQNYFSFKIFFPFIITSAPLAFLGGYLKLSSEIYKIVVGLILLYAAIRFLLYKKENSNLESVVKPSLPVSLSTGAGLGFLSGITGVGGGIFLSPLLLFMKWASAKETAALSAAFIFINSITGLLGQTLSGIVINQSFLYIIVAVIFGGFFGAELGSKKINTYYLMKLLGLVMLIAAAKMIFKL